MDEFRGYRCWTPAAAASTISTEAVSPSRAVFFATHAPLRIQRKSADGANEATGRSVNEDDVRKDFLTRPTANGVLLMPVIGESGTGKSHLIRWIKERTDSTDKRHVIYLPKTHTSLKAVVEALLAGVEDDSELAQLKADVRRMSSELDQAGLQQRLLNQLQEAVAAAPPLPGLARALAGPKGLSVLLLDPHVREHLLQKERLIPALAASLLSDRAEGAPERQLTFSTADLPLDIADVTKASDRAQRLLGLITATADLQVAALELLNSHLDAAVMNASNLGIGRLQNALLDIRRDFARQGKEIVLLIEDFALIQGVQRDLLDAVIEVGIREGRTVLAPIRTLMAVTTGYYKRFADTVLTRAKAATPYVYDLDLQFSDDEDGVAEITSFAGRYLNAARIGREALDRAGDRPVGGFDNACTTCRWQPECHTGFGSSAEGHGLYPFNQPALLRAIHSQAPKDRPREFNPRTVLGRVIRNVLVEHSVSLHELTFPSGSFREQFPPAAIDSTLTSAAIRQIEDLDPHDAERRITFLEFWGAAAPAGDSVDPVVYKAFGIDPLRVVAGTDEPAKSVSTPSAPKALGNGGELSPSVQQQLDDVEDWFSRKKVLKRRTASELRTIISDAVVRRCLWIDPFMPEPNADTLRKAWPPKSTVVSIEDAEAENDPGTADAPIRFTRSAGYSVFFQGLLRARAGKIAGSAEHVQRLLRLAEQHQDTLKRAVLRAQGGTDDILIPAMRSSLIGAALAGHAWPGMSEAQLLAAVLNDGQTWARSDVALRTPRWNQVWDRHRAHRADLVHKIIGGFGISQGDGTPTMVDAARALPLLRRAVHGWTWAAPVTDLPDWVKKSVAGFTDWDTLVEAQVALAAERLRGIRMLLPRGTSIQETVQAVSKALESAIEAGHAPRSITDVRRMLDSAASAGQRNIDLLEQDLERISSLADSADERREAMIVAAVRDRGTDIEDAETFLVASDTWLSAALAETGLRDSAAGASADNQVRELLEQWATITAGENA